MLPLSLGLPAASQLTRAPIVARIVPRVAERWLAIVDRLEEPLGRNPESCRAALIEAIGPTITLQPDASGRFLWAEYGLEGAQMLTAIGVPEIMVTGGRFELYNAYPIRVPAVPASVFATE